MQSRRAEGRSVLGRLQGSLAAIWDVAGTITLHGAIVAIVVTLFRLG